MNTLNSYVKFLKEQQKIKDDDWIDYLPSKLPWSNQFYQKMHQWSVDSNEDFWKSLFPFFEIIYEGKLNPVKAEPGFLPYTWFPNVRLNFAENLLRFEKKYSNKIALNFLHESGLKRKVSYQQLGEEVGLLANFLNSYISPGDVLAAYMPNIPETVVGMLATSSLGGIFTSTSCDFGVSGVLDRFGQTLPRVLMASVSYQYNGKIFDQSEKIKEIVEKIPSIEKVILIDFLGGPTSANNIPKSVFWSDIKNTKLKDLKFNRMPFNAPLYIMYSSGTTGKPKCMVHGVGGTLLQHAKELGLHSDLTREKKIFFFTTCGWMMWNWLMSALFFGAEIVLYEGSPSYGDFKILMNAIDQEKINIFGTGPKFLKALENANFKSKTSFPSLEILLSTGAPLLPEQFEYVYKNLKSSVLISSISGGTDIIGCFMLGNPCLEVNKGEIQCLGLGMDVAAFDEEGKEVFDKDGELVCRLPFPSTPVYFLNDESGSLYKKAYFEKYPGVWAHGDYVTIKKNGGIIVHGRSDATLNPGGVRIGTGEIYAQTEILDFIEDSLCVGLNKDGDVNVILFIKLKTGQNLTEERVNEIKNLIRKNTTPRHVPQKIIAIHDIPYTRSGKKMELLIHRILNGRENQNLEAVANPECLEEYKNIKF